MRILLIAILLQLSFESKAGICSDALGDKASNEHPLSEKEFNALVHLETKNNDSLERMKLILQNNKRLSDLQRSQIWEDYQNFILEMNQRIYQLMDSSSAENRIFSEIKTIQEEVKNYRDELVAQASELFARPKIKPEEIKFLYQTDADAKTLLPGRTYLVSEEPTATVKTVTFNKETVDHLKFATSIQSSRFIKAIQKGFVGAVGASGLKRFDNRLVEVKIMGLGQSERLMGCYENGSLRILKVAFKHTTDRTGIGGFQKLCD